MTDPKLDLSRAVELLERITKYAREDRARTPGTTRLARVLTETESFLSRIRAEATAERESWRRPVGTCEGCDLHAVCDIHAPQPMTERASIAAYLEHVASVQVGTVLSEASREIVGFCASWVRNRLDIKWRSETG